MQEYQRENGHMVLCHIWMRFRRGKQRAESASVVHILESEAWDIGKPNRADEGGVTNNHIEPQIVTGWFQMFALDQRGQRMVRRSRRFVYNPSQFLGGACVNRDVPVTDALTSCNSRLTTRFF